MGGSGGSNSHYPGEGGRCGALSMRSAVSALGWTTLGACATTVGEEEKVILDPGLWESRISAIFLLPTQRPKYLAPGSTEYPDGQAPALHVGIRSAS